MAKLSKEEAEQLAALRAKEEAPEEEDDDAGSDDGHVIVLRGSRADSFLEALLGPSPKPRGRNAPQQPAKTQRKQKADDQGAADDDQGDDDQGDDDQGAGDDAPPKRTNRYFR